MPRSLKVKTSKIEIYTGLSDNYSLHDYPKEMQPFDGQLTELTHPCNKIINFTLNLVFLPLLIRTHYCKLHAYHQANKKKAQYTKITLTFLTLHATNLPSSRPSFEPLPDS